MQRVAVQLGNGEDGGAALQMAGREVTLRFSTCPLQKLDHLRTLLPDGEGQSGKVFIVTPVQQPEMEVGIGSQRKRKLHAGHEVTQQGRLQDLVDDSIAQLPSISSPACIMGPNG